MFVRVVGGAAYVDYPIQHAGVCVVSGAVGVSSSLSIKIDIILYLIVRKKSFLVYRPLNHIWELS